MEKTIMPTGLGGAYVNCFCSGENYEHAVKKALGKLIDDGLHPEEVMSQIGELKISEWSSYAGERWPDYLEDLVDQQNFESKIESGGVVYGPFAAYKPQANGES